MKLNFKVVHIVYAGFGAIIGFLIGSSFLSQQHFDSIRQSTLQVNDVAVPVLKHSNQLQIDLLKLAKLSTLSFNDNTIDQVNNSVGAFDKSARQFLEDYQSLRRLVADGSLSPQHLIAANDNFIHYQQAVESMLAAVKSRIEASNEIAQVHEQLKVALDEGGALLLELQYLEQGDAQVRSTLAGSANQQDGHLFKFFATANRLLAMTTIEQVNEEKQGVEYSISDMSVQANYMKSMAEQVVDNGIMDKFLIQWARIKSLMTGRNGIIALKLDYLTQQSIAQQQLAIAGDKANQASFHLDELLKLTDEQFSQLQSQVLKDVDYSRDQQVIVVIFLTMLATTAGFLVSRSIIRPLMRINKVLGYMAHGDLSRNLRVDKQDEFGMLCANINQVVSNLTDMVQHIVESSTKLTSNLSVVVENSSKEIMEMSDFVELQRTKVDEVNQITSDMNYSTIHVAEQANIAVEQMVKAQSTSQRIDNIAQQNNQRIGDLAHKLDDTHMSIDKLQSDSAQIGGIVEAITSIAEQTNLLALNAAIEAARAGEQGRGFAVVADEVRSLAVRTQQATTEIQTMIEKLQRQIEQTVVDISTGKTQVTECVKYTDELTQSLASIAQAITQIHAMNTEIAQSAQVQSEQSGQIKQKVSDVMEIAEKNADKSRTTLEHSNQIAALADELDHSVHEFKV